MSYFPEDYRYYLQAEFNARLKRRPHYSMRAFARDLGMGASTLVEFMKGKAGFSRSRAQFVASKLRLSPEHSSHFWFLVQEKFSKKSEEKKFARVQLTQKKSRPPLGNEPKIDPATTNLDLALLELIELNPNFSDPRNLAKKLNTSVKKINEALERMDEGKLLDQTFIPWKVRDEASFWGDIGSDENIQLFHRQSLKEAEKALKRPSHERDFRSHVFSVREEDFHLIKEELRDSALQIFSKYNAKPERNSVYCVSYQFFPLTVSDSKNEKARK